MVAISSTVIHYNNNIIIMMISFAPISSDQAQWHDKTKGLYESKLVIIKQCVSCKWMDEDAS